MNHPHFARFVVRKEVSFDAAHRLVDGYVGKCAHLHGHTWRARFEIAATSLSTYGFVRDFAEFKPVKEWIDAHLDHATMVNDGDSALLFWLEDEGQRFFEFDGNPTSENVAKLLLDTARKIGLPVIAVEVDETCTSTARYESPL